MKRFAIFYLAACSVLVAADVPKLAGQLATGDRDTRRTASYELSQLGREAKPALTALIKALDDDDRQVWSNSIAAIAAIGPDAKDAVPHLIDALDSRKSRGFSRRGGGQVPYRSAYALAQIGDAAKPALLGALKADDTGLRIGAARALGAMHARDAVPGLVENLGHSDSDLRSECADSLGLIGADAVQPLIAALNSSEPKSRESSVRALAAIGKDAAPAGDLILKMASGEKEPAVRTAALAALPKVGIEQEKIVPPLIAAFKDGDESVQRTATNALLVVRPAGKTAIPAMTALLNEPNVGVRAAVVLGRYGSEAKSAVPALLEGALKSQPPTPAFLDAVAAVGPPSIPAILMEVEKLKPAEVDRGHWAVRTLVSIGIAALPQLEKALTSSSASVRLAALGSINELGEDARSARPSVLKLAGDPEPAVRATVLGALASLGVKPQQALEALEAGTKDGAPVVRLAAVAAAGAIGTPARPLAARVAEMLDDPDAGVRAAALKAVATISVGDAALGQKIAARLDDPALRPNAIEALAKLGATSPTIAAKLAGFYSAGDKAMRLSIIGAIATGGDAARATLDAAAKDPDAEIRAAVVRAFAAARTPIETFVPILTTALADNNAGVRHAATAIITDMAERQSNKLTPLVQPLLDLTKTEVDRVHALDALREMRVRDLDLLASALASPVAETKTWAIERLGRMGKDARPVREKIEPLLSDGNDYVRRAARKSLESIGK